MQFTVQAGLVISEMGHVCGTPEIGYVWSGESNVATLMFQVTHSDFKKAKEKVMFKKKEGVPEGLYM